ncbi:MAG: glycine/sarcosine/betaine reductase selenoprotein B family protein [Thermoanaerobaculia bacterium]|nr:glycine/sarcosine/betaine reductase selenoprotein B family protein [Thermoanaerobaculia bacterium]
MSTMASLADLPSKYRLFVRTYRWHRIDPTPFTPLEKPLDQARIALVSTAGLSLPGKPFDETVRGGDFSFREIPASVDPGRLIGSHRSDAWDQSGADRDANVAFPIDRIRELRTSGTIGEVNHRHLSFMGSITAPARLLRTTAPAAAQLFVDDRVDAVLLIPV